MFFQIFGGFVVGFFFNGRFQNGMGCGVGGNCGGFVGGCGGVFFVGFVDVNIVVVFYIQFVVVVFFVQQKQIFGESFFFKIQVIQFEFVGKIIGMFLEMENQEFINL